MHAVGAAQRRGRLEQRGPRPTEAVEQEHVGPAAHRQRRYAMAADGDVVDLQQRWAAAHQPEHPFERDRIVEIAAHAQQTLLKRVDARQLTAAQP